ncbi:flavin-containing monooxygenase [Aestuariibacter salexigens]|uniref:flavin-containing monooxygenase n=1 Tax=Aestuariibacter salexigens TaxID=226010 RepID=UPI000408211C|nr:NAD(P)/FAD-dependent oxidoreductase [Aestuariibacter salexigens]
MKLDIAIIGSGFGGQIAAINCLKQGYTSFKIFERRDFSGGTWRQNAYPGAAVDVQSPLYSLADVPYDWTEMFAKRDELCAYTDHIFKTFSLDEYVELNATVSEMHWHDNEKYWQLTFADGKQVEAKFVINATGPLSHPNTPAFKDLEKYQGHTIHSSQWNSSVDVKNKRVAIIGSGASAAQIIPEIAEHVAHLNVFQRTPHWVLPRPDYTFKPWQRTLLRKPLFYKLLRWSLYWALEIRILGFKYSRAMLEILAGKKARKYLQSQIKDDNMRRKLTPDFIIGCKRVIVSSTLYPTLCRDNVTLFDKHQGIERFTQDGIITQDGQQLDVDLVIFATGFNATDGLVDYPVHGKNNTLLQRFWDAYPRAYLGTTMPDFPNLFIVTGPNTGIGHTSALFVIESQMKYIFKAIAAAKNTEHQTIEVKAQAEARYTENIHKQMIRTVWHYGGCNSWYKSKSGKVIAIFPGFSFTFRLMASWFKPQDHHIQ